MNHIIMQSIYYELSPVEVEASVVAFSRLLCSSTITWNPRHRLAMVLNVSSLSSVFYPAQKVKHSIRKGPYYRRTHGNIFQGGRADTDAGNTDSLVPVKIIYRA